MIDRLDDKYSNDLLNDEVRNLDALDLAGLRDAWASHWGRPPRFRSPSFLRAIIAWRLQAAAYGGLDTDIRRRLKATSLPRNCVLPVGAVVSREYRGVRHDVEIVSDGVIYEGRPYRSLSSVAREITGVHWNGPRFFGLRRGANQ
jgi:hypothetical protein